MSKIPLARTLLAASLSLFILALSVPIPLSGAPAKKVAKTKQVKVGDNVILEIKGTEKRVIVKAKVCLREGALEGLLTRAMAKEHEYVLASDCDARHIHTALLLAGAKNGSPVSFFPKFKAPTGSTVKVTLRYKEKGKVKTVPASSWVRNHKTKKVLDRNWVFAGSRFVKNPVKGKPTIYLANHGDLICLVNIETALLDLPVASPKKFDSRIYEAYTARIPPKGTAVDVILEPVPDKKKEKPKKKK
jgi:hypothetical protein